MNSPVLIQWQASHETGIPVIDEQHRGIVSIINSFNFSIRHHNVEFFINNTFIMIDSYTKIHFATEEEILRIAGYPDLENHKRIHESLIKESFSIASQSIRMYKPDIYLQFLKKWWVEHINNCDRMYIESVKTYINIHIASKFV